MKKEKVNVVIEKTSTGYSAYTEEYPVAVGGDSIEEIKNEVLYGLNFYHEDKGKEFTMDQLVFIVDLSSFFKLYPVINAAALSKKVGMNKTLLSQYVTGKKKPSEKQVQKILNGVREVGRELSQVSF
ncbi:helix-turn-helix domain-containing protein [Nafulsella turpanensis]|uniref:helix-turn-helix domain-containing protein n=1 Tax=Nafulsella turpanensis TaxID=1265690 RepID=UPI00034B342E|nr:helix-turn-helix transcriptional regulator [Nafulsella turpanensis]